MRAVDITAGRIRDFAAARLAEGKAAGTVNRDLGVLRRMFILAIQAGKLSQRPHFRKLTEASPRQGFMEHSEYLAIRRQYRLITRTFSTSPTSRAGGAAKC